MCLQYTVAQRACLYAAKVGLEVARGVLAGDAALDGKPQRRRQVLLRAACALGSRCDTDAMRNKHTAGAAQARLLGDAQVGQAGAARYPDLRLRGRWKH